MNPIAFLTGVVRTTGRKLRSSYRLLKAKLFGFVPWRLLSGKLLVAAFVLLLFALSWGFVIVLAIALGNERLEAVATEAGTVFGGAFLVAFVAFSVVWWLDRLGVVRTVAVESGFRQRTRLSTALVALVVGTVLAALVGGVSESLLGRYTSQRILALDGWYLALTVALVWAASIGVAYYAFHRQNRGFLRTDLEIVSLHRYDDDSRELVIRNESDGYVDFRKAKLVDTTGDRYRLDVETVLRPGEAGTFELPAEFKLETVEFEAPPGLGVLYGDTVKNVWIYVRTGEMFVLEWDGREPTKTEFSEEDIVDSDADSVEEAVPTA